MVKQTRAFIRWTPDECLKVGANALQFLDAGAPIEVAFYKAQRLCLLSSRQRSQDDVSRINDHSKQSGGLMRFVHRARELSASAFKALFIEASEASIRATARAHAPPGEELEASPAAPPPVAAAPAPVAMLPMVSATGRRESVAWSLHVEALVAKQVQKLQGVPRKRKASLSALFVEAQELVLPPNLWKTQKSLQVEQSRDWLLPRLNRGLSMAPQYAASPLPWAAMPPAEPPAPAPAPVEAAAPVAPPVAVPEPEPAPAPTGKVRLADLAVAPLPPASERSRSYWTRLEKAKFARMFDRIDGEGVSLRRVCFAAQQHAGISPNRWKPINTFSDMMTRGVLDEYLAEGRRNTWLLPAETAEAKEAPQDAAQATPPPPPPRKNFKGLERFWRPSPRLFNCRPHRLDLPPPPRPSVRPFSRACTCF